MFAVNIREINLLANPYVPADSYGLLGFQIMFKDFIKYYLLNDLGPKAIIFDVGANIGNFSLAANLF